MANDKPNAIEKRRLPPTRCEMTARALKIFLSQKVALTNDCAYVIEDFIEETSVITPCLCLLMNICMEKSIKTAKYLITKVLCWNFRLSMMEIEFIVLILKEINMATLLDIKSTIL